MIKALAKGLDRRRIKTASIVTSSQFFSALATVLQSILLARILPLSQFGALATTLAVAGTLEAAVNARGSETALAAFALARDDSQADRESLARYLFLLDLAWSTSLYVVAAFAVVAYDHLAARDSSLLLGLFAASLLSFPWGTTKGYITVYLSARNFAPVEIGYTSATLGLGVGLAYFFGPPGFVAGMIVASCIRTFVGLRVAGFGVLSLFAQPRQPGRFNRRSIWWFGTTGTIRSFLINGVQQLDLILLAALAGPAAVGLYRAAKTLSGIPQRLGQPIWVLLKRQILGMRPVREKWHTDPVVLVSAALMTIGLAALPGLIFFSGDLMALLFGKRFAVAGQLLWVLLPAAWLLYGVTGWSSTFGSTSPKRLSVISIYLSQVAVILIAAFTIKNTLFGVAIGVAISQAFTSIAFWALYARSRADTLSLGS